jgi:hypothetical protein
MVVPRRAQGSEGEGEVSKFRKAVKTVAELYDMKENDVALTFLGLLASNQWGHWENL